MSGAVFAYASNTANALGSLNAPAPLDEGPSSTCSSASSTSSTSHTETPRTTTTTFHTESEHHTQTCRSESEHETESSTSCSSTTTSSSSATTTQTTTTFHTESEHETRTCENESEHEDKNSKSVSVTETHGEDVGGQAELSYGIVPVSSSVTGKGEANIHADGLQLKVHLEIERAASSTTYDVFLIAIQTASTTTTTTLFTTTTSTTTTTASTLSCPSAGSIGSLVTNHEGEGDAENLQASLTAGTYQIGLLLCVHGTPDTPALITNPTNRTVQLSQTSHKTESESESETKSAHVTSGSHEDEDAIRGAKDSKYIPAVVVVDKSGATASVLDPSFSVSTGRLENGGVSVTISATNVTGPRVLLVNLTDTQSYNLQSGTIVVRLDGVKVQEASSVFQVLNAQPTDPARFIIIQTTSGLQLLVSIPHFSLHTITILPVLLGAVSNILMVDAPLLALSVLAVSSIFALIYARRPRAYR